MAILMCTVATVGWSLACTSSSTGEDAWFVEDVQITEDGTLHYVDVTGTITLNDELSGGFGALATVKFYSDDYNTLIDSVETLIGDDLEKPDETQEFSVGSIEVWLLPSIDGYQRVCVEFSVEDSNYAGEPERLGCIEAAGT